MPRRTVVLFGNSNPQMQERQADGRVLSSPADHLDQSVTRVEMWDGFDATRTVESALSTANDRVLLMIGRNLAKEDRKYAIGVNELEQIVAVHTGGQSPDWVASTDEGFAKVLARYFDCPVGSIVEGDDGELIGGPTALLTNNGRDNVHARNYSTGAQPAAANYIALTANATAPAAADTTLTAEIATAGGALVRAQATYAHTAGTNTTTLTKTYTANGSDALPVTIAKIGVFNAGTAGTMEFETLLTATATLSAVGDSLTITETVTAG